MLFTLQVNAQQLEPVVPVLVEPLGESAPEDNSRSADPDDESTAQISVNQNVRQSIGGDVWAAQQAFDRGKKNLASALYPEAEVALLEALKNAPENTTLKDRIERALYLELPVSAVNQLVSSGRVQEAQSLLDKALTIVPAYPTYVERLEAIRKELLAANVFISAPNAAPNATPIAAPGVTPNVAQPVIVDGAGVVDSVYQRMVEYRRLNGRYPANRRALDQWLPEGKSPLEHFRISYYRTTFDGGYSMAIQNKTNPEQTLRIDATGLLE